MKRVTLLTDFGTADGYVAAMKGAIVEIAPAVLIDDVSHAIPAGDILAGAFALRRYWSRYPAGTVHLAVVDPGVGGSRRALVAQVDGRFLVGPDNGLFTFVLQAAERSEIRELVVEAAASRTFHGRDVFAPGAARLAAGHSFAELGSQVADPVLITLPPPIATEASVLGEVVHIDHFGNLISNIPRGLLKREHGARIAERELRIVATYAQAEPGELVVLINSDDVVEIALRDGNAARALGVERGAPVELL